MGSGVGSNGKGNFMAGVVRQATGQPQHPGMFGSFPQYEFDNTNTTQSNNPYNVNYNNYATPQYQPNQNISGEAFGTGVNSNSDIASVIAGLVSSGVFNQQGGNPYAQPETVPPSHIPYGQQQGSMFGRHDLIPRNPQGPFGGYQGQNWNPYGNYYTAGPATPANTSNLKPADPGEALKRLSLATQTQQNQGIQKI